MNPWPLSWFAPPHSLRPRELLKLPPCSPHPSRSSPVMSGLWSIELHNSQKLINPTIKKNTYSEYTSKWLWFFWTTFNCASYIILPPTRIIFIPRSDRTLMAYEGISSLAENPSVVTYHLTWPDEIIVIEVVHFEVVFSTKGYIKSIIFLICKKLSQ